MKTRRTKAKKYLSIGSKELLYCNNTHSFTVPFIVCSEVDLSAVVLDIWPEPWELPFHIQSLGDPRQQLSAKHAWERWPVLKNRPNRAGGVSAAMNITGTTVFVPKEITQEDWSIILEDLAINSLVEI